MVTATLPFPSPRRTLLLINTAALLGLLLLLWVAAVAAQQDEREGEEVRGYAHKLCKIQEMDGF
jgi:hypothetical protein